MCESHQDALLRIWETKRFYNAEVRSTRPPRKWGFYDVSCSLAHVYCAKVMIELPSVTEPHVVATTKPISSKISDKISVYTSDVLHSWPMLQWLTVPVFVEQQIRIHLVIITDQDRFCCSSLKRRFILIRFKQRFNVSYLYVMGWVKVWFIAYLTKRCQFHMCCQAFYQPV